MEDKIEIGEYVRTEKGYIGKLKEQFTFGNGASYPEPQEWVLDINGEEYIANEANYECIVKHSKNIIDLIKVGDYVNGIYIHEIEEAEKYKKWLHSSSGLLIFNENIYTILTKEQYNEKCYKLEE